MNRMEKGFKSETERICPNCNAVNNPYDNFCSECHFEFPPYEESEEKREENYDEGDENLEVNPF